MQIFLSIIDYLGSYYGHPDVTEFVRENFESRLLPPVNELLRAAVAEGVVLEENPATKSMVAGEYNGGFRPKTCPIGAPLSKHKLGLAVDTYDPKGIFARWCYSKSGRDHLRRLGLTMERHEWTPTWVHLQCVPPGPAGAPWVLDFIPSADKPLCSPLAEQRGFSVIEIVALIGAVVLLIGAIIGGYKYIRSTYDATRDEGFTAGQTAERSKWEARESIELADANATILALQKKNRALERAAATAAQVDAATRRSEDEKDRANQPAARDAVRGDLERLCAAAERNSPASPRQETGSNSTGAATPAGPGLDATGGARLLGTTADFLTAEALRANGIVRKLQQAQKLLLVYLNTCNPLSQ